MSDGEQGHPAAPARPAYRVLIASCLGMVLVGGTWLVGSEGRSGNSPGPEHTRVAVVVSTGSVVGGTRTLEVARGQHVTLKVTADIVDDVHVHGYDLKERTSPGRQVEVAFDATIPGEFEVELEESRLPLIRVRVS